MWNDDRDRQDWSDGLVVESYQDSRRRGIGKHPCWRSTANLWGRSKKHWHPLYSQEDDIISSSRGRVIQKEIINQETEKLCWICSWPNLSSRWGKQIKEFKKEAAWGCFRPTWPCYNWSRSYPAYTSANVVVNVQDPEDGIANNTSKDRFERRNFWQ